MRWSQVRPGWPDREIHLFGAGVDSGTYDYFTEAITGKEGASRGDFTSSEDDNVLVQGVAGDELALGFLPFAYYVENKERLKLIPVDNGKADDGNGPIAPSLDTIRNGTYQPLARPLFIYVSQKSLARPEVAAVRGLLPGQRRQAGGRGRVRPPRRRRLSRSSPNISRRGEPGRCSAKAARRSGVTIEQLLAKERQ